MKSNIFLLGQSGKLQQFGSVKLPEFKEQNNLDWIINGTDPDWWNLQPQYYEYLASSSPKNAGIIKAKNRYVYGKGWAYNPLGLNQQDKLNLASFIKKIEGSKVTKRLISDRTKQGGFACEMIPDKGGKTVMPHFLAFKNVRVAKKEYNKDGTEKPQKYFYTSDWSKKGKAKENKDFTTFYAFTWGEEKMDKAKRYLVYYRDEEYMDDAYPLPEYMGGVPYIDADCEVGNFVKNNVKNGFSAGWLVNFYNGEPSEEQKAEIEAAWKSSKHGTDKAGENILSFNENKDAGVEITPLSPNGQDDRYVNLNKQIRDEVFTAHCTPFAAVEIPPSATGLSNNADQDRSAIEKWIQAYVTPVQEIFNEFFNNLIHFNGLKGELYLQRPDPIKPQLSEATLTTIATLDEIREIAGLPQAKEEGNPVADALKSLSPLVQNKILESMSVEEIRSLIRLQTPDTGVTATTVTKTKQFEKNFSCENFEKFSTPDEGLILIDSKDLYCTDIFDAQLQAQSFRQEFASDIQNAITKLLSGDPELTVNDLSKLLKEKPKEIGRIIKEMQSEGLLEGMAPTAEAVAESGEDEIFVVYKYEVRSDAPPLITESRPFCVEMLRLSKTRSWTIDQIQQISAKEGYDVFARRGGWYHNPDTGKNTPYCRHIFSQRLVRKK